MEQNLFGKKLRELRIEKRISQRELGERLGVCNQTVSFWETGSREPDLDTLISLSRLFDVSIDVLLGQKDY